MNMQPDDDDQPTVVLDFDSIKEQLKAEEELTEDGNELFDTEKILEAEGLEVPLEEQPQFIRNVYLFNYQTDYFTENSDLFSGQVNIFLIYQLDELNQTLREDPECTIVFYYNTSPKVVNQLCGQIKKKFSEARTLIIAKGLSAEKAQKHHDSKYGANAYLKDPFGPESLIKSLNQLN